MEYLSKRGTMATEDMEEKKKDLTGRKKKDPDSKIRQAIGKPLELIPSPEEVKSGGEQLCSRRNIYVTELARVTFGTRAFNVADVGNDWKQHLQVQRKWLRPRSPITQRTCHHQEEDQICQPTT